MSRKYHLSFPGCDDCLNKRCAEEQGTDGVVICMARDGRHEFKGETKRKCKDFFLDPH